MILLSLDPGLTTGWAILGETSVHDTGKIEAANLRVGLIDVFEKWAPSAVVVEVFPLMGMGDLTQQLRKVMQIIHEVCFDFGREWHPVTPGVWKTSSIEESPKMFNKHKLSPHERDAIRMGRYYLRSAR